MKSILSEDRFHNEEVAFSYVESKLWPNGPVCKHCGETGRIGRLRGKTTRPGLYKCYTCRKPFTVRQGTVFESSHVPLRIWLQVIHLMTSSKKGVSTKQIHRALGGSMTTAWFLTHRVRECMKELHQFSDCKGSCRCFSIRIREETTGGSTSPACANFRSRSAPIESPSIGNRSSCHHESPTNRPERTLYPGVHRPGAVSICGWSIAYLRCTAETSEDTEYSRADRRCSRAARTFSCFLSKTPASK